MVKYLLSSRPGSYRQFKMHAYEHLPEIGVHNVEIDVPSSEDEAKFKLEMFEDLGLHALSLSFPIKIDKRRIVKKFEDAIPVIKMMDPMYIFSSVKVKKEKKREKGYSILQEIGDIAKANDIFISIETHPHYNTNGDRGKETMEHVNHPNIRINFDTANIYYYNKDVDGKDELKKVIPWLGSIHIKDCMKRYHDWSFPAIGDGKVDFPGIFDILGSLDQTIPLTLELEGVKGKDLTLEQAKDNVARSFEYLRNINDKIE